MSRQEVDPFDSEDIAIQQIEEQYTETDDQLNQLSKKIKEYQSQALLAKENGNPELLSNTLIRLARVNSALGSKAAYAAYIARNAERAYRRVREGGKLKLIAEGMAVGKAESQGYVDAEDVFQIYSQVQLLADTASDMSYRTDTFLKMCQSGLSLIKQDIQGRP